MKISKIIDRTTWKFILVGIVNTIVGTGVMFVAYNVLHLNYWISSASNYVAGSIVSYFLNKHFTFRNTEKGTKVVGRFILNITVCYLLAYGGAKQLVLWLLSGAAPKLRDNVAMLVGMGLFVVLNYLGQRLFAFREKDEPAGGHPEERA